MDYDDEDYDDSDQDSGGDLEEDDQIEDIRPAAAAALHKPYKTLKEEDIKHLLENDISEVSGVLSVPRGVACALLCLNNWSPSAVYDQWFAAAATDGGEKNPNPSTNQSKEQICCKICYENSPPERMVSAACGHPFCVECWSKYIATAVGDGAGCLTLRCPEPGCREAVTSDMVEKLSSEVEIKKYNQYLIQSYVESSRRRKWCPAACCNLAIEFDPTGGESDSDSYEVACSCSHKFCWRCAEERHRPLNCKTVAEWAEKNQLEAENTTWILAYTKPCPKCGRAIEKNQGCNHMTCRSPCRFEFCWICGEPWKGHGSGYYSCNNYKKQEKGREEERSREKAKGYMQRYTHYFERWDMNDKSRKIAKGDLERSRKMYEGSVGMQFVVEAWEQVLECRHVLKWSYVYGYYLPEEEGEKKALFEYLQGEAEAALERLHHCVEKEMMGKYEGFCVDSDEFRECKVKLLDLTRVTSNYFENLVVALENDLVEVESSRKNKERMS